MAQLDATWDKAIRLLQTPHVITLIACLADLTPVEVAFPHGACAADLRPVVQSLREYGLVEVNRGGDELTLDQLTITAKGRRLARLLSAYVDEAAQAACTA